MPKHTYRTRFIGRSVDAALGFLKESVFSDEIAREPGFLQKRVAPGVKAVLCLCLVIATSLARSLPVLAGLYLASVVAAAFSRVRVWYFLKRVWVFIPLFALLIAIPAVFTAGPSAAALFVLRVATSVSWVVLLTVTTPHNRLIRSLRRIGVPAVFVQVLDMTYRYLYLFISVFEDMHLALQSKLVRRIGGREGRAWVAGRMGYLFTRSARMSEEVYLAMVARGYATGDRHGT